MQSRWSLSSAPLAFTLPAVVALLMSPPRLAHATPQNPEFLQTLLKLDYTPPCSICHVGDQESVATAVQPFANAMKENGLEAYPSQAAFQTSLDAVMAQKIDSDCNGIIDTAQLQDGRDPNPPGDYIDGSGRTTSAPTTCVGSDAASGSQPVSVLPEYGCGAQIAGRDASATSAGILVALVGFASMLRRRAPTRRRSA